MGNDCMCRQCNRDAWTRTFPWTHTDAFTGKSVSVNCCAYVRTLADVSVNVDTSANATSTCWCLHLQAHTQRLQRTQTLPWVKLQTLVSRYVSNCQSRWWWDSTPILCRRLWIVFLTKEKMFASAHLSSAVAGINRDSCHHQLPQCSHAA